MTVSRVIGLLGGTFDPVHNGHLAIAFDALTLLSLDEVRLVPCHRPPHRNAPALASSQRADLLQLAVQDCDGLSVDTRELAREQASYTVTTLKSVREEVGEQVSIVFIMGADAFAQLDTWYEWQRLRELAHIVVMARPNSAQPAHAELQQWLQHKDDGGIVHQQCSGSVIMLQQRELDISATKIRQGLFRGEVGALAQMPKAVADYITAHQLYGKK
jgi:nicotinate-nucleotide adenylyltransferase